MEQVWVRLETNCTFIEKNSLMKCFSWYCRHYRKFGREEGTTFSIFFFLTLAWIGNSVTFYIKMWVSDEAQTWVLMSTGPLTAVTSIVRSTNCGDLKSTLKGQQFSLRIGWVWGGGRDVHWLPEFTNWSVLLQDQKDTGLLIWGLFQLADEQKKSLLKSELTHEISIRLAQVLKHFFYLVIIASNHKSHRLFIWPWHLDQPIINWFDFCFFISIYPHKSVYTGQLMMKDWCTHSMAIRNVGPRWQDKKRCCKSQSAF